jgi:phage shock protein C
MSTVRRLTKSHDKLLAGVCGGIADYFGLDSTAVRVGYVILSIFSAGFPGLLLYFILWLIIPKN